MNEEELLEGIKEIVSMHYTIIKESYEELKVEIRNIDKELDIYIKFLKMIKKPNDFYKKNVNTIYENQVLPAMIDSIEDLIKTVEEENYVTEANRLTIVSSNETDAAIERIRLIKARVRQLKDKKESIGTTSIYSEQLSRLKKIIKGLNSNMYFEDEKTYNHIIEYITESDIISEAKQNLLNCIKQKRNHYIEKQESIKKEQELRLLEKQKLQKSKLEQQPSKKCENDNKYKFRTEDFIGEEDSELIKLINKEIYENSDILNNLSPEIIKIIKESLKYEELEIKLDTILPNHHIENHQNIVILYEVKKLIDEIEKIFDYLKSNNDLINIQNYQTEVSNYLLKINELFSTYQYKEDVINKEKNNKTQKHIIYITNSSGNVLLKNDLKKVPEYYKYFEEMLEDLKSGIITHNYTKDAKYSNNNLLNGVCKKKASNARLVYYPYGDCYIVLLGFIKKSNNDTYDLNIVSERFSNYKSEIDKIIENLSDPEKREKLIEENDIIHSEIMNYLKSNSRDKKKESKNGLQ